MEKDPKLIVIGSGVVTFVVMFLILYYAVYNQKPKKDKTTEVLLSHCLVPSTFLGIIVGGGYHYYSKNKELPLEFSKSDFWEK